MTLCVCFIYLTYIGNPGFWPCSGTGTSPAVIIRMSQTIQKWIVATSLGCGVLYSLGNSLSHEADEPLDITLRFSKCGGAYAFGNAGVLMTLDLHAIEGIEWHQSGGCEQVWIQVLPGASCEPNECYLYNA